MHETVGDNLYSCKRMRPSRLCQKAPDGSELVRYIHFNPLRAGIVLNVNELDRYTTSK